MIFPEDIEDIRRAMELTDDDRQIKKDDLVYSDDRLVLRFGCDEK
jgi:hypothetical protein